MHTPTIFLSSLILTAVAAGIARSADKPEQPARSNVRDSLTAAEFARFHALIKPKPGGFDEVPWLTSLWQARQKAAAEGKPILLWVGDGHPLGWT